MQLPIQTNQLNFDYVSLSDAEDMLAALRPQDAQNLSFFKEEIDLDKQREYLERMCASETDTLITVVEKTTGRIIGTVGLHEVDMHSHNARLGILIFSKEDRGKGLGREMLSAIIKFGFQNLNLNKIYLHVFLENKKAQDLYQKYGFVTVGILPEHYWLDDKYHDMLRMALLKRGFVEK